MNSIWGVAALRSHGAGVSSVRWTMNTQTGQCSNFSAQIHLWHPEYPQAAGGKDRKVYRSKSYKYINNRLVRSSQTWSSISIIRFHEREASILYPSCFDANAGLFEQICGPEVLWNFIFIQSLQCWPAFLRLSRMGKRIFLNHSQ